MSNGKPNNVIPFPGATQTLRNQGLFKAPVAPKPASLDEIDLHKLENIANNKSDVQSTLKLLSELENKYSNLLSPSVYEKLAAIYAGIPCNFPVGKKLCATQCLFNLFKASFLDPSNEKIKEEIDKIKRQTRATLNNDELSRIETKAQNFIEAGVNTPKNSTNLKFVLGR